jgi:hypothetical protein
MPKHEVRVDEPFTDEYEVGALVVDGKELDPAQTRRTHYAAGQILTFNTKKDAEGFAKHHKGKGRNVVYVGKAAKPA